MGRVIIVDFTGDDEIEYTIFFPKLKVFDCCFGSQKS